MLASPVPPLSALHHSKTITSTTLPKMAAHSLPCYSPDNRELQYKLFSSASLTANRFGNTAKEPSVLAITAAERPLGPHPSTACSRRWLQGSCPCSGCSCSPASSCSPQKMLQRALARGALARTAPFRLCSNDRVLPGRCSNSKRMHQWRRSAHLALLP